jgi:hypothetical protein
MKHQDATLIHVPYNFTFANSTTRSAGTGYTIVAGDIGKLARQTDNNTLWLLIATTPAWIAIGSSIDATRVIRTTNQSINSASVTAISFDTETYDYGSGMWVVGSPTRITAVIAGVYAFTGVIRYDANSTGERSALVRVNGSTLIAAGHIGNPSAGNDCTTWVSGDYHLAATDYLELCAFQNSGGALNAQVQASYANWFAVHLVRAD